MARPGIMLYFDILEPIRVLPDADKGRLLVAMLEYGEKGIVPQFEGMLALAWGFVQPKLDKDDETYEAVKIQRRYAAFCKKRAAQNLPKIGFEEWKALSGIDRCTEGIENNEPLRAVDFVASRYPTTTTPTTTSTTTPTTTSTTTWDWERAFRQIWDIYPEARRGSIQNAKDVFKEEIQKEAEAMTAIENLELWKRSSQWTKSGGQYVPYLSNWISKGTWRESPAKFGPIYGASGKLGEAELEAIRRTMADGGE